MKYIKVLLIGRFVQCEARDQANGNQKLRFVISLDLNLYPGDHKRALNLTDQRRTSRPDTVRRSYHVLTSRIPSELHRFTGPYRKRNKKKADSNESSLLSIGNCKNTFLKIHRFSIDG